MASLRILITGVGGFIGSHLIRALGALGHDVQPAHFDLCECESVDAALRPGWWDCIIHLAGMSHVPSCERDPTLAYRTNVAGTAHLLEAIRRHCPKAWLVFASTAQVYAVPNGGGLTSETWAIEEGARIAPQNVYARTKWISETMISDVSRREGLPSTTLRLFNHTHMTQSQEFFVPHLYHEICASASASRTTDIQVGNLNLYRDIGSIQDLLSAFAAVIRRGPPEGSAEVFNVCSGGAKHLLSLAQLLAERLGASVRFVEDPARIRPNEPRSVLGSHSRLTRATGWVPVAKTEDLLLRQFLAKELP